MAVELQKPTILPEPGNRAIIIGKTGSGKTAFATWLLERIEDAPVIIYDTKGEEKFPKLPNSIIAHTIEEIEEAIARGQSDYIIYRPPLHLITEPEELDKVLLYHHLHWNGIPAYVDELYHFHRNTRSGPGLIGILTRGRSKRQTFIGASQKPKYFSQFALSESDKYYIFRLQDKRDRSRIADVIPDFETLPTPKKHAFWFYDAGEDKPLYYPPVPIDNRYDTGYTGGAETAESAQQTERARPIWI